MGPGRLCVCVCVWVCMDCMCVLVGALVRVYGRVRTCRPSVLKASAVTLCVCVGGFKLAFASPNWKDTGRPGGRPGSELGPGRPGGSSWRLRLNLRVRTGKTPTRPAAALERCSGPPWLGPPGPGWRFKLEI